MTTAQSPLRALKAQADKIAMTIKAAERGEKIEAARKTDSFTVGVMMDDKLIKIEMPWTLIKATSEVALAEYILNQMRESRDTIQ